MVRKKLQTGEMYWLLDSIRELFLRFDRRLFWLFRRMSLFLEDAYESKVDDCNFEKCFVEIYRKIIIDKYEQI
jgi:hypothetical protein